MTEQQYTENKPKFVKADVIIRERAKFEEKEGKAKRYKNSASLKLWVGEAHENPNDEGAGVWIDYDSEWIKTVAMPALEKKFDNDIKQKNNEFADL